jgi:hypothetical protein
MHNVLILPAYCWTVNGRDLELGEKLEAIRMKYLTYRTGREADR